MNSDKYNVAGLFDAGRPATEARAKRVCDCSLRIGFHNLECVASFSFFAACAASMEGFCNSRPGKRRENGKCRMDNVGKQRNILWKEARTHYVI